MADPPAQPDTTRTEVSQPHIALSATEAAQSLADATITPVRQGLRAVWLRGALLAHLASTLAATLVALQADQGDWQLYVWAGLGGVVLVGNFMRWHRRSWAVRRLMGAVMAIAVTLAWAALLADRAHAGKIATESGAMASSGMFWLPALLLALCAALLVVHLLVDLKHRLSD
jgi:hypothetical protein